MKNPEIEHLLREDRWKVAQGKVAESPFILRFRDPITSITNTAGYSQLLTILLPYVDEGSGALPSPEALAALDLFEDRLCGALEHDGHAMITAVLTFDGARQWVVYTEDIEACGQRITEMPQNADPYPIEMHARDDPEWNYLRREVLHVVSGAAPSA